ncbi:hypothetical protein ACLM5J_00905 [Nocardioides sp. Bht2]|uniref:hypothetical protein n=1 Tax=Nocardioides sp. Bht2 TaxID=3392297 RepID=UPI0039B51349
MALVGASLVPVQAAAFAYLELDPSAGTYVSGPCVLASTPVVNAPSVPITPNGSKHVQSAAATATYQSNADPTDTLTQSNTLTAQARATAVGNRPASMTLSVKGSTRTTASKASFACPATTYTGANVVSNFTLTTPTWANWALSHRGPLMAEVDFSLDGDDPYFESGGEKTEGSSSGRYLLPPGSYNGYLEAEVRNGERSSQPLRAFSAELSISFAPIGSASARPSGKAKPYVTLPASRSCATHDARAKVTSKAKRAKKIASIAYTVNGKKTVTLKGNKVKRSKATSLKIADHKPAKISAVVKLKNGKKLTTRASYLACSL